jgi:hypothetical protein
VDSIGFAPFLLLIFASEQFYFFYNSFRFNFRLPNCTIMQGVRCACRGAGSVAQLVLGKQRHTISNSRWTKLAYQPAANFHSMFSFYVLFS